MIEAEHFAVRALRSARQYFDKNANRIDGYDENALALASRRLNEALGKLLGSSILPNQAGEYMQDLNHIQQAAEGVIDAETPLDFLDRLQRLVRIVLSVYNRFSATQTGSTTSEAAEAEELLLGLQESRRTLDSAIQLTSARLSRNAAIEATHAAGKSGSEALEDHFARFAKWETGRAGLYQLAMALTIALALWIGFKVVGDPAAGKPLSVTELSKSLATLPVLAFAYYLAREGSTHSASARRARELAVRLRAVGGYVSDLSTDMQMHIRGELGNQVFRIQDWDEADTKDKNTYGKELLDIARTLSDVVMKLASGEGKG